MKDALQQRGPKSCKSSASSFVIKNRPISRKLRRATSLAKTLLINPSVFVRVSGGTEYSGRRSFSLDAGELDHLAPLLGFVGDELAEVGGRPCEHRDS